MEKDGVGKSIVSANIAISLAQKNSTVVIVDADLGAANMHTCLGMETPVRSLIDYLSEKVLSLSDCITPTPYSNLYLISGAQDSLDIANPSYSQIKRLIQGIRGLEADYIILDLGGGTNHQIIDMFNHADRGFLVALPEPTSIENTYRFIKHAIYRKFKKVIDHPGVHSYLQTVTLNKESSQQISPAQLVQKIALINSEAGAVLDREINSLQLTLILNQVISNRDIRLGFIMKDSCQKYFGVTIRYVGAIESDKAVLLSSRERKPILIYNPFASSSRAITQITNNILNGEQLLSQV